MIPSSPFTVRQPKLNLSLSEDPRHVQYQTPTLHMTVQGMHPKQKSQPPHSQSKHPALGPVGLVMDDVELLEEVGKTELTGSRIEDGAMMIGECLLSDRLGCPEELLKN